MLLELEGGVGVPPASDTLARKYTWGLDLAGVASGLSTGRSGLETAGGIGGLLAVQDADATPGPAGGDGNYLVFCDATLDTGARHQGRAGNVGQLVAWSPNVLNGSTPLGTAWHANRLAARYEYDAYGNVIGPDTNQDGDFDAGDQPGPYTAENPLRFSTKYFDAETGLGYWGYRYYSPSLGRWMSRDPMGERGGLNVYSYVRNRGADATDALGLSSLIGTNACEKLWCTCNPICCDQAYGAANYAHRTVKERYGDKAAFGDNHVFNAIKHCVAQCAVAKTPACSCEQAKGWGDAHECGGALPANDMDYWNNTQGRQCAGCSGSSGDGGNGFAGGSKPLCIDCCERKALSGELRWIDRSCPAGLGPRGSELCGSANKQPAIDPPPVNPRLEPHWGPDRPSDDYRHMTRSRTLTSLACRLARRRRGRDGRMRVSAPICLAVISLLVAPWAVLRSCRFDGERWRNSPPELRCRYVGALVRSSALRNRAYADVLELLGPPNNHWAHFRLEGAPGPKIFLSFQNGQVVNAVPIPVDATSDARRAAFSPRDCTSHLVGLSRSEILEQLGPPDDENLTYDLDQDGSVFLAIWLRAGTVVSWRTERD